MEELPEAKLRAEKLQFAGGELRIENGKILVALHNAMRCRKELECQERDYELAERERAFNIYMIRKWEFIRKEIENFYNFAVDQPEMPMDFDYERKEKLDEPVRPKHTELLIPEQIRVYEIPSIIASVSSANALGDFCAKRNFMKESYAKSLGIPIDRSNVESVSIGSGKTLWTTGSVQTPFRFENEPGTYSLLFHLLPDCIHDVILGKPFLKATKTFSLAINKARQVVSRIINGSNRRDFLYLGDSAPRFTGLVNGHKEEALADSGAKVLIMDEDYARSRGLPISTDGKHQTRLRFADGSTAMTSGMSYGVRWEFGPGGQGEEHILDFHILKNAPATVILNDEFLLGTNAFAEFDCYLIDEDDEDEDAYFFVIDVDISYHNGASAKDLAKHRELIRHGEEIDRIDDLPLSEQPAARAQEEERQKAWNAQQASTAPSAATTPTNQPQPKRSRWRFKLSRKKQP